MFLKIMLICFIILNIISIFVNFVFLFKNKYPRELKLYPFFDCI